MWIKLLQQDSMRDMMRPQLVNGKWRRPLMLGRDKLILKHYFLKAGVPWIYDKPTPEVHTDSPYNRAPKGRKHERTREVRLAELRKSLSTMDEKLEKMRRDRIINKPLIRGDKDYAFIIKSISSGAKGAGRPNKKQKAAIMK